MNSHLIENFYDVVGYVQAYSVYLTIFFFFIKPSKITTKPFYLFFINVVLSIIFDAISLFLHEHLKESEGAYFAFIMPFYAVKNILFLGLFFSFYVDSPIKKYLQISTVVLSILIVGIYYFSEKTFSAIGSLFQSFTMITYMLITLNHLLRNPKKILNRTSTLYIIFGFLFAYSVSVIINLFYGSLLSTDKSMAHLFYGIKNIFWLISNLFSAYAIYKLKPSPNASLKPSQ